MYLYKEREREREAERDEGGREGEWPVGEGERERVMCARCTLPNQIQSLVNLHTSSKYNKNLVFLALVYQRTTKSYFLILSKD